MGERFPQAKPAHFQSGVVFTSPEIIWSHAREIWDLVSKRSFDIYENSGRCPGRDLDHWIKAEKEILQPVRVEVLEDEPALFVRAEVPGFTEKEIEVSVEPRRITITGKREITHEKGEGLVIYSERQAEYILRCVDLPANVIPDDVTATLRHGVLTLELPRVHAGVEAELPYTQMAA
jgi:HSP20 family molecular chaperone IbpA